MKGGLSSPAKETRPDGCQPPTHCVREGTGDLDCRVTQCKRGSGDRHQGDVVVLNGGQKNTELTESLNKIRDPVKSVNHLDWPLDQGWRPHLLRRDRVFTRFTKETPVVILRRNTTRGDTVPSRLKVPFQGVSDSRGTGPTCLRQIRGAHRRRPSTPSPPHPLNSNRKGERGQGGRNYATLLVRDTCEWAKNQEYFYEKTHLSTR